MNMTLGTIVIRHMKKSVVYGWCVMTKKELCMCVVKKEYGSGVLLSQRRSYESWKIKNSVCGCVMKKECMCVMKKWTGMCVMKKWTGMCVMNKEYGGGVLLSQRRGYESWKIKNSVCGCVMKKCTGMCVMRKEYGGGGGGVLLSQRRCYSNESFKPPWNILFFGTNAVSVKSLEVLHKEQQKVAGVVDKLEVVTVSLMKPLPAVRRYCRTCDLPLHTWPLQQQQLPQGYHIGVVVSFGHLIPAWLINAFPMGIINVHLSLLPRWRGAAPIIHTILYQDCHTGITIMKIQPHRFDVGSVLSQVVVPVAWNTKSGELTTHLAEMGAQELISVLHNLPEKLRCAVLQSDIGVTKAPKISGSTALVEWSQHTRHNIQAMFLALDDYFPLWTHWQGTPIKLRDMVLTKPEQRSTQHRVNEEITKCEGEQITGVTKQYKTNKIIECQDDQMTRMKKTRVSEILKTNEMFSDSEYKQTSAVSENNKNNNSFHITGAQNDCHKNVCVNDMDKSELSMNDYCVSNKDKCESSVNEPPPGSIVYHLKSRVISVKCVDGWVSFRQVVMKGRKPMSAHDFYNGFISKVPKEMKRFT